MKVIQSIQLGNWTCVGVSRSGVVHLGYWNDDADKMKWVPKRQVLSSKRLSKQNRAIIERL